MSTISADAPRRKTESRRSARAGTRKSAHKGSESLGRILVGTASWSDPGYIADWYPKGLPARERLPWYAQYFNLVEVNSTFYAVPDQKVVANWAEQTPADF